MAAIEVEVSCGSSSLRINCENPKDLEKLGDILLTILNNVREVGLTETFIQKED